MNAEQILETAANVVRAREEQHGKKRQNLETIARLWSAYLEAPISAHDVAQCMQLLKIARSNHGQMNPDDYVDAAGYAALAAEARTWK